ncbi:MAG: DUF3857 domain-containing protein [Bacteroidota bacterium]
MRQLFILLFVLGFPLMGQSQKIKKTKLPKWVHPITYESQKTSEDQGGYAYLLLDFQENIPEQELYRHYAIKIMNTEGIQAMSDIDVGYDPTYQKMAFHQIRLVRDGNVIDRLGESTINVFQRETQMERSLYDGSLTAVVNLWDVREGDIIEYAYSIKGFNPINKKNYATTFYQEYTSPVNRIYNRIVASPSKKIYYKLLEGATPPKVVTTDQTTEYIWDTDASRNMMYDTNVPPWYDIQKRVFITTFKDWGAVADWARELYTFPNEKLNISQELMITEEPIEERIVQLIRFVQDEIRYLGFESGIGAYKPNKPLKVYQQRYGDCKDKSLLLASLLQNEGIVSFPVLVNTQIQDGIQELLPSHNIFDHCIVYFNFEDKDYFIDPTSSNQGGNLENLSFPSYGVGLLVRPNENELRTIPETQKSQIIINEVVKIDSINGGATLDIETEYTGSKANYIRSYFNTTPRETIRKEYLNFYSNLYPNIQFAGEIRFNDGLRSSYNSVYIEESYILDNAWSATEEGLDYFEVYPLVLESLLNYPSSAQRKMPYYLGEPYSFSQKTSLELPENWPVENTDKTIKGDGFKYTNTIKGYGSRINIAFTYDLSKEVLLANEVASFQEKNDEIQNDLSFYLTHDPAMSDFKLSWISIVLFMVSLASGIFFALKIYKEYNPNPSGNGPEQAIGGWLVLPAIGLVLSPILLLVQIFDQDTFNHTMWSAFYNTESGQSTALLMLYTAEQCYNYLFLIFNILLIILFFKKRTSLPRLITLYYALSFVVPLLDLFLVEQLMPDQMGTIETQATYKDIGRSFIGALIWIPYFAVSQRVKNTFLRVYGHMEQLQTQNTIS